MIKCTSYIVYKSYLETGVNAEYSDGYLYTTVKIMDHQRFFSGWTTFGKKDRLIFSKVGFEKNPEAEWTMVGPESRPIQISPEINPVILSEQISLEELRFLEMAGMIFRNNEIYIKIEKLDVLDRLGS